MKTLIWQGGEHSFAFPIGTLRALQDKTNSGPGVVLERLGSGHWLVDDIVETLRLGLIGGGMDPDDAKTLVLKAFDEAGAMNLALVASAALLPALVRNPDEPAGEGDGAGKPSGEISDAGTSARSTDAVE